MSLEDKIVTMASAIGSDVKGLIEGKAEKEHTHTAAQVSGLGTAATTDNGVGYGQNIINSATRGQGNISYSGTLQNSTNGTFNTAAGANALAGKNTGSRNTAVGYTALYVNTAGSYNTAVGGDALLSNTSGNHNTATGQGALRGNSTGSSNTAIGSSTLYKSNKGSYNTAVGGNALHNNTTGQQNTAVGVSALQSNTTGQQNTATGAAALANNTTGHSNTASGRGALGNSTAGNYNTAVGLSALLDNTDYNNCGGFGYNSQVTASNQIQLGDSETTVYAYGAVQNRSDARDKTEIRDTVLGLDFINAIRPVDYKLDMREDYRVDLGENPTKEQLEANKLANIQTDGTHTRKRYHHGVIAQQVAETMEALGVDFGGFQDHSKSGGDDVLSIGYEEFIAPLIKAVQELSARVKELEP